MSVSHNRSIRRFGLRRLGSDTEPLWIEHILEWIHAEFRDPAYWENLEIRRGDVRICEYTVSPANHLYVTNHVNLTSLPAPRMKYRDMIVDNWRNAGEDLGALRKIATMFITNEDAMGCIQEALEARGQQLPETGWTVVNLRNSPGWDELCTGNPFVEGQSRMLREYRNEFNRARIGRITVAVHERSELFEMHVMNMVTHFTRSTGHRRQNQPATSQPESSQAGPSQGYSQDYAQQQFPEGVQFSNWNIGPY
ncbi:hypothetical protein F5Y02DRAFT_430063 [Annulohypoxylon stygium]|nr:hypothetical protein F5Y02DRAFT_430063 [Annulohypoxylon stygium]